MIRSPLRYPGGKSRAIKIIKHLIPSFLEFREPFVGGGSVFFYLKQVYPDKLYWINDLFENLYIFYKAIQLNPEKVIQNIYLFKKNFVNGKKLYNYLINNLEEFNFIEKAAAFFVLNRITFSGTTQSGGYSEQAFKTRFTENSINNLKKIIPLLQNVKITNYDYSKLLIKDGKKVFIFLDPPYYKSQKSLLYGKNGKLHRNFDYNRLAYFLKNTEHLWLMTIDNSDYIRKIFKFAYIYKRTLTYGMRSISKKNKQKENELFISNYKLENIASDEILNQYGIILINKPKL